MKKILYLTLLIFSYQSIILAQDFQVEYDEANTSLKFSINDFHLRATNIGGTEFTKILFGASVTTKDKGFAEIPFLHASLQIDVMKNVKYSIVEEEFEDYPLSFPLIPSRGIIYRDQDPSLIPYETAPESITDSFYPEQLVETSDPFIIKDVRGTTIYIFPFRYNAAKQILRVYTRLTIKIQNDDSPSLNPMTIAPTKTYREMEGLYNSVFLNYKSGRDDLSNPESGDILVISTSRDQAAIQPYIQWKREKGYEVFEEIVATGTNVKSLIQQQYNSNNDLLYVLLVGDWADIKSDLGGGASAPTDPMLGCVAGTDYYPDIAIGRFSANSADDVSIQVNKVINYEKNPTGNWYSNAIGVASNQGPGDDNELDYQQLQTIYDNKLDPFTYNNYSYAYDPTANSSIVKTYIEEGAGIINYCGHGSMTSWSSSGFSNSNVNQLNNASMLPIIFSVACVNGAFHSGECFAEAWLKKENGGAVITLMSTINQAWDPPMRGQDYFNDILTGGYSYSQNPGSGIDTDEGRTTIGSIVTNGLILTYTESNGSSDLNTIKTWTTFGDPSMQVRTATATSIYLSNTSLLSNMPFTTSLSGGGQAIKSAMVCLSQNGNYQSAYTDDNGSVTLPNNFEPGEVKLVVTAFNTETLELNLDNQPASGAHIILETMEVNDNNGQLDAGETVGLNIALKNIGVEATANLTANLSCADQYISLVNDQANFGIIPAGSSSVLENAFSITANANIPDQHLCNFQFLLSDGNNSWTINLNITGHAPVLKMSEFTINDASGNNNGNPDPGEIIDISISITNTGSSDASDVSGDLSTLSPYISILSGQNNFGNLNPGDDAMASFEFTCDASTPTGTTLSLILEMSCGSGSTHQANLPLCIGQTPVLIVDLDKNKNSATHMTEALDELNISFDTCSNFPTELDIYSSIFLCLGVYSNNYKLSLDEGISLASYLNSGGSLYMEGGDTWYFDDATAVHAMFGINGLADGSDDMRTLLGQSDSFTENMSFIYYGDNNWMDHIEASGDAQLIFENQNPAYGCGVANDQGSYKTIGTSFEFGGLANNESSRLELMERYLEFFDLLKAEVLQADFNCQPTEITLGETIAFTNLSTGNMERCTWDFNMDGTIDEQSPNPFWKYQETGTYSVQLIIWDTEGDSSVMTKENYITVNAIANQFNPVWETPFNPMTLYINEAQINSVDLQSGAQIGIFDIDPNTGSEICVGASTLNGVINQSNYLEIIASMDDGSNQDTATGFTQGNPFIFKFINHENEIISDVNISFPFAGYNEVFTSQGSAIVILSAISAPPLQQNLLLNKGWTAISSFLVPNNTDLEILTTTLPGKLEIMQDLDRFYQPGNQGNNLQTWDYKSGYLIKMNESAQLQISGTLPTNTEITLQTGWNLMSVLSESSLDIQTLFAGQLSHVVVIKEAVGTRIFWPGKNISTLNTLEPGKAYLIKISQTTIIYFQ